MEVGTDESEYKGAEEKSVFTAKGKNKQISEKQNCYYKSFKHLICVSCIMYQLPFIFRFAEKKIKKISNEYEKRRKTKLKKKLFSNVKINCTFIYWQTIEAKQ